MPEDKNLPRDLTKSVELRREYLSSIECYKIVFGLNGLDLNNYFEPCRGKTNRAIHEYKIQTKSARVNWFKTEFAGGPGRGDTCHLFNLDVTLPD